VESEANVIKPHPSFMNKRASINPALPLTHMPPSVKTCIKQYRVWQTKMAKFLWEVLYK
jgi:hypothetical protein